MSGGGIDIGAYHNWGSLDWGRDGACRTHKGPDWWHPPRDMADVYYPLAKAVCNGCPVRQACEDYATGAGLPDGIWGGKTPQERGARGPKRRSIPKASQVGKGRKLTDEQMAEIARLVEAGGMSRAAIARKFNVSRVTVYNVVNGVNGYMRETLHFGPVQSESEATESTGHEAAPTAPVALERPTQEVTP